VAAKKKKKGARASDLKRQKQQKERRAFLGLWARRITVALSAVILIFWGLAWFVLSEAHTASAGWVKNQTLAITAKMGFRVKDILVEGRQYSDSGAILALMNVQAGDPILALNPAMAKEQIEKITWVESVHVERRLPDTIYIRLTERTPLALWENEGKVFVIDSNGVALTQQRLDLFKDLLMIRGEGAPEKSLNLSVILQAEKDILTFIDHAILIDGRRWDLLLEDGKRIKLPEKDASIAVRSIMQEHQEHDILNVDSITNIDARYAGRLIVSTKLGKVQDYKTDVKKAGTPL